VAQPAGRGVAHQRATELKGFGVAQQVVAWLIRARLDLADFGVVQYSSAWFDRVSHGSVGCLVVQ
jgi:hypothetical protein